jgi:indole-3-glycerol phosphate synthase
MSEKSCWPILYPCKFEAGEDMETITKSYQLPETLKGTILEKIMHSKVHELIGAKSKLPASSLEAVLENAPAVRSFKTALMRKSPAIIAEIKKASPSAGLIRPDFDPLKIAEEYQRAGAAAISVITEVHHFHGGLENLASVRWHVKLPLLRKDFIVDPYQIIEARHAGADAILLIAALLDAADLKSLIGTVERYGMEALVEVHSESELQKALEAGANLIGVNNRDLRTFTVTLETSLNLARKMPKDVVTVTESGIRTAEDIRRLMGAGYRGFLVGEQLMRAPSPGAALAELMGK